MVKSGRSVLRSFRSKYKELFRSETEICSVGTLFYPTKKRINSLLLERKDHEAKWLYPWLGSGWKNEP